ncbi:TPA: SgrR family transcriptional regulator [Vibrio alginolyticus]|uniref:SgrR family transcriptional regulator n=2 Tax=Vibrio harveyi group TaxID=717610 RepID=UPI001BD29CF7|nr:SgrR family transcriptional regulator [Vibrio alginolyticus]MBS9854921.1 SgrR family transcriptional regulator [Vibrio alginolyticus]MCR9571006.1 SgrR family transcriptional regulator [Vibrio alginolyticus]MCS0084772.1 SgrR family transcriptional regulator [Vibrio alginolyticus]
MVDFHSISTGHLQRLKQLEKHFSLNETYEVDIAALADILVCSERYVSKLMASFDSFGFIRWDSGKGRGHRSKLTLLKGFEPSLFTQLERMVCSGNINQAYRIATQFGKVRLFQDHLPHWLGEVQQELKKQNTLMYLVPYLLPEWRPFMAQSARSILLIDSIFDTLVRYHPEQQKIIPHLAHQFYYSDKQIRLRIRNDVVMHNGKLLTPRLIKSNIEMRRDTPHPYQILFRHIEHIEIDKQWIVFYMNQCDPVFLHLLADSHSAIFDHRLSTPIGCGAYQLEKLEQQCWSLVRNRRYFGLGGHIERVEFWSSDAQPEASMHVVEQLYSESQLTLPQQTDHSGCTVLQFHHHEKALSAQERAWIVHHSRQFTHGSPKELANSVINCHQDKGFHLFNHEMKAPARPVRIEVAESHITELKPLLDALSKKGVVWQVNSRGESNATSDVSYDCYVFGDDLAYQYYEWMLCGNVFRECLPERGKQSLLTFVDMLMQESNNSQEFLNKLYRAEDWLIQNYYYCPLWWNHFTVTRADNLYGTETNNMGVMSLVNMWFE